MKKGLCFLGLGYSILVLSACNSAKTEAVDTTVNTENEVASTNDAQEEIKEVKDNCYDSMKNIPSYNNYPTFLLADALNEDWFNQVGVADDELIDDNIKSVELGYDEDTNTDFLIPDAIVFEGLNRDETGYSRYVLPKDVYMQDSSRNIIEYVIKYADSVDNYDENLDKLYNMTDEDAQELRDYYTTLFPDNEKGLADLNNQIENGMFESQWKDLGNLIPLRDAEFSGLKLGFEYYRTLNKDAIDTYHMLTLSADDYNPDYFRVLLVYDDLDVNIEMRYDNVDKDDGEICVLGDLNIPYYADINKVEEKLGHPLGSY